ncbi:MAG: hypothetical protein ACK56F_32950 [bacterium]
MWRPDFYPSRHRTSDRSSRWQQQFNKLLLLTIGSGGPQIFPFSTEGKGRIPLSPSNT